MRETVTLVICLFLFLLSLQLGLVRTGLDYDTLNKQVENLQTANERLGEELERMTRESQPGGQADLVGELRAELARYREAEGERLERLRRAKSDLQLALRKEIDTGEIELLDRSGWLVVRARDGLFFDRPQSTALNADGRRLAKKIASYLRDMRDLEIRVVAYMDREPGVAAETLRQRSLARAESLAAYLQTGGGVDPVQLAAAGYGPYRPLAPNDSAFNRVRNRRVEIQLEPVNQNRLEEARRIVRLETQAASEQSRSRPAPETKPEVRSIGEEALETIPESGTYDFDAGYEKPPQ